jgi:hypothetical protein
LVFEHFSKICRENSSFLKIREKVTGVLHKDFSHLCQYLAEFFLLLLLTATGLSPGGSSPTLVQTKIKIHKTTKQLQNIKEHKTTK